MTKAIVFDLYGTLLTTPPPTLHREIPRALGIRTGAWLTLVRDKLLTRPFKNAEELAHFICEELAPGYDGEREARCVEIITEQLSHVEPMPGVQSLLTFLKHRGFGLGLLSNLSSSYKEPLERFDLAKMFDTSFFSCDEGLKKPDPETYRMTAARLETSPEEVLFVGDSLRNDVEGPSAVGMHTLHIGTASVPETHLLGLHTFNGTGARPLVQNNESIGLPGGAANLRSITPVSDDEQGRYNLVYRIESDSKTAPVAYLKRFLLPESAYVEELAYRVHALVGLPTCEVAIHDKGEPLLVMTEAKGLKYDDDELDPDLAWEVGRHFAFAYVFSNADIRPRNAFLDRSGSLPEVTMIDLEHCFFNLAFNTEGLDDPFDPNCLDAEDNLPVAKQVLTDRAMRRARRSFVHEENITDEVYSAYQRGFREFFEQMHSKRDSIISFLDERVHRKPYLVVGTHSYRRAMASIDVREMGERLTQDPMQVMSRFC